MTHYKIGKRSRFSSAVSAYPVETKRAKMSKTTVLHEQRGREGGRERERERECVCERVSRKIRIAWRDQSDDVRVYSLLVDRCSLEVRDDT